MNALAFCLLAVIVLCVACFIVEQIPCPPMPKRIGQSVLALVFILVVARHFHYLGG